MDNLERENRISEALILRNMKQVELCEKAGINKSSLSHWINQHWQPKQKALMSMARVLEVSELWLAGYDVPKERPVEQIKNDELAILIHRIRNDENIRNLVVSMSRLTPDQLSTVAIMVNEFNKLNQR